VKTKTFRFNSNSHATSLLRKLVAEVGVEIKGVTDKSISKCGATHIHYRQRDAIGGRDVSRKMAHIGYRLLYYKVNLEKYKKSSAKNI
jgi:hypothetical protein